MAESKVRVDPTSIRKYGASAQAKFNSIRADLVALVHDAATVHYFGPNAEQFKKDCSQLAADVAARLLKDIGTIADAVKGSTSNIASSLGGQPISITVNGSPIPIPAISHAPHGVVDVDLTALEHLIPTVQSRFKKIDAALNEHLTALRGTDWTGNAKTTAVEAVSKFTKTAIQHGNEAEKSITDFVRQQIDSTRAADK